jgi:hypothetical protein
VIPEKFIASIDQGIREAMTTGVLAGYPVDDAAVALRWFGIGGRYAMAVGLLGLTASIQVQFMISRIYITKLQDRIIRWR